MGVFIFYFMPLVVLLAATFGSFAHKPTSEACNIRTWGDFTMLAVCAIIPLLNLLFFGLLVRQVVSYSGIMRKRFHR